MSLAPAPSAGTPRENTMRWPSGDQSGEASSDPAGSDPVVVTATGLEPSALALQMRNWPLRLLAKAILVPSRLNTGWLSVAAVFVS